MGSLKLINNIINQRGTPAFNSNTFANRPAAGYVGRIFISTDTFVIQRDNGTGWDSLGGGGGGITGSGAAGQATFWTGASAVSGDNAFFWDNTNKRLGINTATPGVRLDVHGTGVIQQLNGTTTNNAYLDFQNAGLTQWRVGNQYVGAINRFSIFNSAGTTEALTILQGGNVGINDTAPGCRLSVTHTVDGQGYIQMNNLSPGTNAQSLYLSYAGGNRYLAIIQNGVNTTGTVLGIARASLAVLEAGQDTLGMIINQASTTAPMIFGTNFTERLRITSAGISTFTSRVNVNNATDNSLFELNNNGNFYTGGLSPTILTVGTNTTMARTVTGYYCTATLTLTLPSAASINNVYWVIAASGVTVTVNRAGSDDILNLAGTSVTSITITSNQRAMFYVGGGTRTFLISQA